MESILDASASSSTRSEVLGGFFSELVRTETRLYNDLNDRMRTQHGIYASQYELLRYVRDHPDCRVADIATHFAIGVGASSKGMDRLEAQGWLVRERSETDRRAVLLRVSANGERLVANAERTFDDLMAERVDAVLSPDQVGAVHAALTILRVALQSAGVGAPIG